MRAGLFTCARIGRFLFGAAVTLTVLLGTTVVDAEEPLAKTRAWVVTGLRAALKHPPDMNRIISMLYAVAMDYAENRHPDSARVMEDVAAYLEGLDVDGLKCGQLVDLRMAVATLGNVGRKVAVSGLQRRFDACDFTASPFDLACALFYYCHFTREDPAKHLPRGLAALAAMQRSDGGFGSFNGLHGFYFTSHAVFAIHACDGNSGVVGRGQHYMVSLLPRLRDEEFMDGLLETLLMLDRMGVPVPERDDYTAFVDERVKPDGGICYFNHPGCEPDWHTTGLLLELLRVRR